MTKEKGGKKYENFADVINGWPLKESSELYMCVARRCKYM